MKRILFILFLLIVCTFNIIAQYSQEPGEKYVGQKRGKFPFSVEGLRRAIDDLDSGVVYISYPGFDTTGLGAVPSNVYLRGWINNQEVANTSQPPLGSSIIVTPADVPSINNIISSNVGGVIIFTPGTYDMQLIITNDISIYLMDGVRLTHSTSRTILISTSYSTVKILGKGVIENTSEEICIVLTAGSSDITIECDSIINRGIPSNLNPNAVTTGAVYGAAERLSLTANYVGSDYNVGIYLTGSDGYNYFDIRKLETGLEDDYESGSTALLVRGDTSFVYIDEIIVHNIGHTISHRGGYLYADVRYMETANNRNQYAIGISAIAVQQGDNTQHGEIHVNTAVYRAPDTVHVGKSYTDATAGIFTIAQGVGDYWLFGGDLYQEAPPDTIDEGNPIITMSPGAANVNLYIRARHIQCYARQTIYMENTLGRLFLDMQVDLIEGEEQDYAGTSTIWCLADTPYVYIRNTVMRNNNLSGTGENLYFYERIGGEVVLDNVRFISEKTNGVGNTIRFYPFVLDTIAGEIYVYNNVSSNQPFLDDITWRGDTSVVRSNSTILNGLKIDGSLTIGDYTLPNVDGTNLYQLTTDGAGNVSWQPDATGGSPVWGSITGTLSNQSDLQLALNLKANSTHAHSAADITSGILDTARYHAYDDLVVENKIGTSSSQVAAGDHNHAISDVSFLQDSLNDKLNRNEYVDSTHYTSIDKVISLQDSLNIKLNIADTSHYVDYNKVDALPDTTGTSDNYVMKYDFNTHTIFWGSDATGGSPTWGSITGTLSDQSDLQSALNNKLSSVVEDPTPDLGGPLNINDQNITNTTPTFTITPTELSYLDGVTSNIQTQLDDKSDSLHYTSIDKVIFLQDSLDDKLNRGEYAAVDTSHYVDLNKIEGFPDTTSVTTGYVPKKQADGTILWEADATGGSPTWGSITGTLANQSDLQLALNNKAAVGHAHSAADITSGILDTARYHAYDDLVVENKIGTSSSQVAAGDHNHDGVYEPAGVSIADVSSLQDSLNVKYNRSEFDLPAGLHQDSLAVKLNRNELDLAPGLHQDSLDAKMNRSEMSNYEPADINIMKAGENVSLLNNDAGYLTSNQTITLSGDATGAGTTTIAVTVVDDSHNHVINNVDGLQDSLNTFLHLKDSTIYATQDDISNLGSGDTTHYVDTSKVIGLSEMIKDSIDSASLQAEEYFTVPYGLDSSFSQLNKTDFKDSLQISISDVLLLQDSLNTFLHLKDSTIYATQDDIANLGSGDTSHYVDFDKVLTLQDTITALHSEIQTITDNGDPRVPFMWAYLALDTLSNDPNIPDSTDAPVSTVIASSLTAVGGNDVGKIYAIGSLEYRTNTNGTWTSWYSNSSSSPRYVKDIDSVQVRDTSSASNSTETLHLIFIGGQVDTFSIITVALPVDTIPSQFTFNDSTNATVSTQIISDPVVLAGFDSANVIITDGDYRLSINDAWTRAMTMAFGGDTIWVVDTSSAANSTATNVQVDIGGTKDTFTVTTVAGSRIFADDFEDSTFNAWVVTSESGNVINIESDSVNSGNYSAAFVFDSTAEKNELSFSVPDATQVYYREYLNMQSTFEGAAAWSYVELITIMDGTAVLAKASVKVNSSLQPYLWRLQERVGYTTAVGANNDGIFFDSWAYVEVGWEQGDSDTTGYIELRVNGDSICAATGFNHLTNFADSVKIGQHLETGFSKGTYYIDDVVADSTAGWVGAKP